MQHYDFTERELFVNKLREEGKTFRAIGETLGVTGNRANQIHKVYKKKERYQSVARDYRNGVSKETIAEKLGYSMSLVETLIWRGRNKAPKR
jgi:DNA-binding NarL/FixJ family response regulator